MKAGLGRRTFGTHTLGALAGAALAGLGGCAAACGPVAVASLRLLPAHGYVGLPASIGGVDVDMVMDTGAETSIVTPAAARVLGLRADPSRHAHVVGVGGGVVAVPDAIVPEIAFGGLSAGPLSLPVTPLVARLDGLMPPVAGLIGMDLLSGFDLDIDRAGGRVDLYRAGDCGEQGPPWRDRAVRIRLMRGNRRLLLVPVVLDGVRLAAVVDTGARRSMVSAGVVGRLGIDASVLAAEPVTVARGVDGRPGFGHLHLFRDVRIGGLAFADVRLDVGSTHLGTGDMLLGEDFFRAHRVWLSAANAVAFVERTNGGVAR